MLNTLDDLERQAARAGLLLRVQVRRPLNIWTFKLVVAQELGDKKIRIWGEMKAWAYPGFNGFQLDTMRVNPKASKGVGSLIWSSTMAWALENTPCRRARLLAIRDGEKQHAVLVKYFSQKGFDFARDVGSSPLDLPLRMVWGGAGSLMVGDIKQVLLINQNHWHLSNPKI